LKGWVPEVLGFEDGVLYQFMDRLVESDVAPEIVADYAIARARSLRVKADGATSVLGRSTVIEVATEIVGGSLRRADVLVRLPLVYPVVEHLLRVDEPSIVDGSVERANWIAAGDTNDAGSWRKVDFADSFTNRELLCYDAVYDVASPLDTDPAQDRVLTRAARSRWEESAGRAVDPERWLIYRLVHGWRLRRAGASKLWFSRHASSALQDYVGEVFLFDLDVGTGGWCALDIDGVLETDTFGASAPGTAGAMALRALVAHDYRVIVATGRSVYDVADRCAAWPLAGGVAEYGSAIVLERGERVVDLRTAEEAALMERVRALLSDRSGIVIDPDYRLVVRAFRLGDDGRRRGLDREDLTALYEQLGRRDLVQVVPGECQSDITPAGCTKATGTRALLARLDPGEAGEQPLAFAIGDGVADLQLLELATMAATPRHSGLPVPSRVLVTHGSYQAGLADAVAQFIGHRPGSCPVCTIDRSTRSTALFGLLSVLEAGAVGIPERLAGAVFAARRLRREPTGRGVAR